MDWNSIKLTNKIWGHSSLSQPMKTYVTSSADMKYVMTKRTVLFDKKWKG